MRLHLLRRGWALTSVLLVLAGCAPWAGDGGRAATPSTHGALSPPVAAVRAFATICGRLDEAEVLQRAASYNFVPVPPEGLAVLAPEARRERGLRILARGAAGSLALLAWNGERRSCELAIGGVEPAAVEAEFDVMVQALQTNADFAVTPIPARAEASGPKRLRRGVLVSPKALVAAPPRVFSLLVDDNRDQALRVSLKTFFAPRTATAPQPPQWELKR